MMIYDDIHIYIHSFKSKLTDDGDQILNADDATPSFRPSRSRF